MVSVVLIRNSALLCKPLCAWSLNREGKRWLHIIFSFSFVHAVLASFLEHPAPTVISAGGNVTFNCSAVGYPVPKIFWTRNGKAVNGSFGIEITTLPSATLTSSVLTIISARVNLTGVYRCLSITTIDGFPPRRVESSPANLTVQGMRCIYISINVQPTNWYTYMHAHIAVCMHNQFVFSTNSDWIILYYII